MCRKKEEGFLCALCFSAAGFYKLEMIFLYQRTGAASTVNAGSGRSAAGNETP